MLKTGVVQVVARGADVAFVIDENAPFDVVTAELKDYLAKQSGLWSKGDITMNVGQRMLAREELTQIKSIIETESGLTVTRFWFAPDSLDSGELKLEAKSAEVEPAVASPAKTSVQPTAHNEIVLPTTAPETSAESVSAVDSIIESLKAKHNKNGARNRNITDALFIKSTFQIGRAHV